MGTTIALWNVVGKTLHGFAVGIVPLHGHFYGHAVFFTHGIKCFWVQYGFSPVHVLNEAFNAAWISKVFTLTAALIDKLNFHTVIEEGQFAYAFSQYIEVVLN